MDNADRKLLTEKMGGCWHVFMYPLPDRPKDKPDDEDDKYKCKKCGQYKWFVAGRTFDTPDDFFAVWGWAKEQEWWIDFIRTKTLIDPKPIDQIIEGEGMCRRVGLNDLIDYFEFPELIVQFGKKVLGWT